MRRIAALVALVLLPFGSAHGPGIEVSRVRLVTTTDGSFLEMTLDTPDSDERHDLLAVSTRQGAAELEQEQAGAYQPADAVPVGAGPMRFDALTPYRIRVPRPARGATEALVTLMFGAGDLVHANAVVVPPAEGSSWPARLWAPALLVLGALGTGLQVLRKRRVATS